MRNSSALRFAISCAIGVVALSPTVAHAHPGHDGHELTWDLGHLAAYPLATLGCLVTIAGLAWAAGRVFRPRTPSGSNRNRPR